MSILLVSLTCWSVPPLVPHCPEHTLLRLGRPEMFRSCLREPSGRGVLFSHSQRERNLVLVLAPPQAVPILSVQLSSSLSCLLSLSQSVAHSLSFEELRTDQ
jgi:hypothetical protein